MVARMKVPKCKLCGKKIQILSYDVAYLKIVRPGDVRASFVCWRCAEGLMGEKLEQIVGV